MKKNLNALIMILFILMCVGIFGSWTLWNEQISSQFKFYFDIPSPPPQSLDALYPPKSEQPIYLFSMLDMESSFNGIIVNLMEEDYQNARSNYDKFKQKYATVSKLVPEWEKDYPIQPVEELGASLETGDKGKIMASIEGVGKVCNDCHVVNMVKVQQKYHWRDFENIAVTDPLSKESVNFTRLMQFISMSFSGIAVNLEEGQVENAKTHYEQFKSRFISMKASCTHCHITQRKYYVDENVQSLIEDLGKALNETTVDPRLVGELGMKIGQESCEKCHLVHVPAALTKRGWKMLESGQIK